MIGLACLGEPQKCGVLKAGTWPFVLLWIITNCIGSNMVCQQYSREDLFRLGLRCTDVVPDVTALRKLGISATATHRGCRGSGYKKPIPTVSIPSQPFVESRGVHKSNLSYIKYDNAPSLAAGLLNVRSACNKSIAINDYVVDSNIDILSLTETWIKPSTPSSIIAELTPPGYSLIHVPRPSGGKGGGVGLIYRDTLTAKLDSTKSFSSFEFMSVTLMSKSRTFKLVILYRPPTLKKNGPTFNTFLEEFPKLLEDVMLVKSDLFIMGDFNIHIDDPKSRNAVLFMDLLIAAFGLVQHIHQSTHKSGHTLDLLLSRQDRTPSDIDVTDILMSDHYAVSFTLPTSKPPLPRKELTYRRLKAIDMEAFACDISESRLLSLQTSDPDELAEAYNSVLAELLNKHAPQKTKTVTVHPPAPWYNEEIMQAKRDRRRAERKWRQSGLCVHRDLYGIARDNVSMLIAKSKEEFYKDKINSSDDSQRSLFACVKELLGTANSSKLPSSNSSHDFSDRIANFFVEKIAKIKTHLEEIKSKFNADLGPETELVSNGNYLAKFDPTTEEEVKKIIMSSACTSCCLDPVPSFIVKKCLHILLPVITRIINLSFESAKIPDCYKMAAVIPLLKKIFLDPEFFPNLRPVSTLPFVSKTMERVAGKRLVKHKDQNNLHEKLQSAYREAHSTETALMRIQNDILCAIDQRKCIFLVLLDLSAAFDTVDHAILLKRLSDRIGIRDQALRWLESYLHDRSQFVIVDGKRSAVHKLDCNVPQGSVLGPGLFSDYDSPVADIFRRHNIQYHLYADDTQIYLAFDPSDEQNALSRLESCIQEVRLWMAQNSLKLNDSKTEFIVMGSKHGLKDTSTSHITIGDSAIEAADAVKNIGATLDKCMKLDKQVNLTCRSAWFNLFQISKIKKYLSEEQIKSVMQAFVISKIDQNNGLLVGSPACLTNKLQSIQNAAAKLICGINRWDHVPAPLEQLHWLPVEYRVQFKVLLLVYKSINNKGPEYLKELLIPYAPDRCLRSASSNSLVVPRMKLKTYGDRAFSAAGPKLWNQLPVPIKNSTSVAMFKRLLKTHFFRLAFNK